MAHGEKHAKKTVMDQAMTLEVQLSNGHAGDPNTHGAALLLLLQMIKPIFNACLVTEEECLDRMENCPNTKNAGRIGWPICGAILGTVAMICGVILQAIK